MSSILSVHFRESPNITSILTTLFGVLIVLVLCGYFCKKSRDPDSEDSEETKSLVIAREVKPGYLIIQGNNNEEIFRIIKEYDSAKAAQSQSPVDHLQVGAHVALFLLPPTKDHVLGCVFQCL